MRVAVGNIKNRPVMPQRHVRADIKDLMRLGDTIVLGCELGPARYDRAWRWRAGQHNFRSYFKSKSLAISILRDRFKIHARRSHLLHRGRRRTSPRRWVCEVKAYDSIVRCEESIQVTHYVSGAWNDKKKRNKRWRQIMWKRGVNKHRALVAHRYEQGRNQIIGGDVNRLRAPNLHPDQVVIADAGLMSLIVVPAPGWKVVVYSSGKMVGINSDHPFIYADFTFVKI